MAAKKTSPAKKLVAKKKPSAKRAPAKKASATRSPAKPAPRKDFGAPVEGFFAKQGEPQRTILETLHAMVREAAPEAVGTLKWGMPFFAIGSGMMCALTSHKSHVNLVLSGPPGAFADPDERLSGDGKTGRHLKLLTLEDLPRAQVKQWLRKAAELARAAS